MGIVLAILILLFVGVLVKDHRKKSTDDSTQLSGWGTFGKRRT